MNTEDQPIVNDNDIIEGVGAWIAQHIRILSGVEGTIKSVRKIGNSFYITFDNDTQYIQPCAYKNTNTITLDNESR